MGCATASVVQEREELKKKAVIRRIRRAGGGYRRVCCIFIMLCAEGMEGHCTPCPSVFSKDQARSICKGMLCRLFSGCWVRPSFHVPHLALPSSFSSTLLTKPSILIILWREKTSGSPLVRLQAKQRPGRSCRFRLKCRLLLCSLCPWKLREIS